MLFKLPFPSLFAACLWFAFQDTDFFKEEKVLIKLKEIEEDREHGSFQFKVLLLKRPDLHPNWLEPYFSNWSEPESDDDLVGPVEEIFSSVCVSLNIIQMDSLQKCTAFMLARMRNNTDTLAFQGKPLPKHMIGFIQNFISQDMYSALCFLQHS